ncbi:MAG: transcriptional regulator [Calditrichota bacterium]
MKPSAKKQVSSGLPPLESLDRHIHEPARLQIMAYLSVVENADFIFLLNQTGLTRGNLSAHLTKLEAAGYVSIKKEFVKRLPRTVLALTRQGKAAFQDYLKQMKNFLEELHDITLIQR